MTYETEADLVADLRSAVPVLWGGDATSRVEVRCHDQASMDVLVTTPTALIAVEAKLANWGKVLVQAFMHRYCVDYTYVAMPAKAVTEGRLQEARRFGIGVIAVDNRQSSIQQEAARCQPADRIRRRLDGLEQGTA